MNPLRLITILSAALLLGSCTEKQTIYHAVQENDVVALQKYLDAGQDPAEGPEGEDLVYEAAGPKGGLEVLQILLKAGASPNGLDPDGRYTPLMNAASWAQLERCKALIEAGADPERFADAAEVVTDADGAEEAMRQMFEGLVPKSAAEGNQ